MKIEYMTDEQMRDMVKECGLDWQRGYLPLFDGDPTNRYAVLIEAVVDHCARHSHPARDIETTPRTSTPTIDQLLDSEEDVGFLWAEIHRLRAALQGPDEYATWQDAAVAERVRRVKAEKDLANFDSARSAFCAGLGAVLTYTSNGRSGVHGMTIGADGSGDFAVLFMGTWADSESSAAEYLSRLHQAGYRISTAHIVPNQRRFSGDSVRVVDAPLARIGRRAEPCAVCGAVKAPE